MPLNQESSSLTIHENIKKLIGEGKSRKEALAIAYDIQRKNRDNINSCSENSTECLQQLKKPYLKPRQGGSAFTPAY